jgi:hypothetical protein
MDFSKNIFMACGVFELPCPYRTITGVIEGTPNAQRPSAALPPKTKTKKNGR